jgi:hypothetical protein
MKRIAVVVLALLVTAASLCIDSGCATDKASLAELSEACKDCYALHHAPYNTHEFDQYTVTDLQVVSETTTVLAGARATLWSVRAKLYDPDNRYVGDIEETIAKTSFGWVCQ